MRIVPAVVIAAVTAAVIAGVLAGCGDDLVGPAPPTSAPSAAVAEALPVRERQHADPGRARGVGRHGAAWQPSVQARELARRLCDPATREATLALLDELPKGERIDVLRAGLRLEDPEQARFAASLLEWTWMDEWESALAVQLLAGWIYARPDDVDFGEFRSYLGSSELGPVLAAAAGAPEVAVDGNYVGQLHRQVRAEHVGVLVDLCRSEHRRFAADTLLTLGNILAYGDGPRESVGELIAATDTRAADEGPLPRGAIPPELARALRAALFGSGLDGKSVGDVRNWALRWLADVRPTAGDSEFLLDLFRRLFGDGAPDWALEVTVLRALSFLDDPRALRVLRSDAVQGDGAVAPIARALLARRGDVEAAATTWERFETDANVMAFALESDPRRAGAALARALLSTDLDRTTRAISTLAQARDTRALFRLRRSEAAFALVRAEAPTASVSPAALGWIALRVPGCRTREVARAVLEATAARPDGFSELLRSMERLDGIDAREIRQLVGLLEVAFPERLREVLRAKAAGKNAAEAHAALSTLLILGDAPSGARLVEFLREEEPSDDEDRPMFTPLARSRHEAVESHLRTVIDAGGRHEREALAALASYHGLPERVAIATVESADPKADPALAKAVRDAILAGRPVDGLVALLAAGYVDVDGLGDVRDPRVAAHLEGLRLRREVGAYAWATGELAVLGDPEARAEVEAAVRAGRYRWVDNWRADVLLAGAGPAFWLGEAESNCCRLVVVGSVFEDAFGQDHHDLLHYENGRGETPAEALRRWWSETGGKFAWSHMTGGHVPVPR